MTLGEKVIQQARNQGMTVPYAVAGIVDAIVAEELKPILDDLVTDPCSWPSESSCQVCSVKACGIKWLTGLVEVTR